MGASLDRLQCKQHNERIKLWSSIVGNLGAVLFAAVAGFLYAGQGSDGLIGWGFVSLVMMVGSGGMMVFLLDEDGS